jgi:hypothetical protein
MVNATPIEPDKELEALLEELDLQHVVLEFAFYQSESPQNYDSHFDAAYEFLDASHKRFQQHYATIDFEQYPLAKNHVHKWNPDELIGSRISFAEFWGSDHVAPTPLGDRAWSIPNVDGFKTAFFLPPYGLQKPEDRNVALFEQLKDCLFGDAQENDLVIYSWSNQCSGYFDAGLEWWGAFLWTIARHDASTIALIGASSTD